MVYKIFILQELSTLVQTNEDDIEEKVRSNTADLKVRKTKINCVMLVSKYFLSFQILNTKVIFNAQVTYGGEDHKVTGNLTFDRVNINIGDGFDGPTGIFEVPISGIYQMSFSGLGRYALGPSIIVFKNGYKQFDLYDFWLETYYVSYTWMMSLVQGDEVQLDSVAQLLATSDYPLTFTGQLIHIEN